MTDFAHRQSAHCESGVVANMVSHGGLAMNEPMAFGLSSALTFAYMPMIKMAGMPLIAYRMPPGHIIKGVAKQLGMKTYSVGDLHGKIALERGMNVDEYLALGATDTSIDQKADEYQAVLGQQEDNFIMDSRLAWHFIPQSFKVFLDVDVTEAARRIFEDRKVNPSRADEPEYASVEEVRGIIENRLQRDDKRYQERYGVSYLDRSNFDLVIDTTHTPANEVVARILAAFPVAS